MYAFEYRRPRTLEEAARLLRDHEDARALAGGQSLLPALRLRLAAPRMLVDLQSIPDLRGITLQQGRLHLGAMSRHADVARSRVVAQNLPALAALAAGIGDQQIRNLGTLGGSLANNDPAACYPAAALALDALMTTNRRVLTAREFLAGLYETALQSGEVLTSVSFAIPAGAAYLKLSQPASRFALVGVFVARLATGVRIAVTGAGLGGVFRATGLEECLDLSFSEQALDSSEVDPLELSADLHASAQYRAHLIAVLTRRAVRVIAAESG
jgi:carbon-monoxide dehydrogenase medium subunit